MPNVTWWTRWYQVPFVKQIARRINLAKGIDIPCSVKLGKGVEFPHNSLGTVIHPFTAIDSGAKIYQNVTIGRGDIWQSYDPSNNLSFLIKEGAILCAGCKVIASHGKLIVGKNTIIAANAVLLESTGDNEVWAGVPARKIKDR